MPVYEYLCETHGPFTATRPISAYADPCDCPICGVASRRVMLTAPSLGARDAARSKAYAVNERAADSPRRASELGDPVRPQRKSKRTVVAPDGSKCIPSARPWSLSL